MTISLADIEEHSGPRYRAIADVLAADIAAGRLAEGERLPTQRALAERLGVTVGTVTRAYAEAERRGLVAATVGRGSFVRDGARVAAGFARAPATDWAPLADSRRESGVIDLTRNALVGVGEAEALAATLAALARRDDLAPCLDYQAHAGLPRHRAAGSAWIARRGLEVDPERVLVTVGAQHAMHVAFAALCRPGDTIALESLTYPGMKALAERLSLRAVPVATDAEGLVPESLEEMAARERPVALYTMPTAHNPLNVSMSAERRAAVAEVARRHGLWVVEDDVYGFLEPEAPPPLVAQMPERGLFVTSASKSMAPGLRVGWLAAPTRLLPELAAAARASLYMGPPLMAEVAGLWIEDGTADRLVAARLTESRARQAVAAEALAGLETAGHPQGFHVWLPLPAPWQADALAERTRLRGLAVTSVSAFAVGAPERQAVRLSISAAADRGELARGLALLRRVLTEDVAGAPSVV